MSFKQAFGLKSSRKAVVLVATPLLAVSALTLGALTAPAANAVTAFGENVVLNEIESNAKDSNGNDLPDWVELYNTGDEDIVFEDVALADDNDTHVIRFSGTIEAGGFFVIETDDPNLPGNFGLGNNDAVRLYDEGEGPGDAVVDEYSWTQHAATTYGLYTDGEPNSWVTLDAASPGAPNQWTNPGTNPEPDAWAGVVINEVRTQGTDFIELYNTTTTSKDISGAILSDDNNGHQVTVPAGTVLDPGSALTGSYAVVYPDAGSNGFGLGANDEARLFAPGTVDVSTAEPIDRIKWTSHAGTNLTWGLNRGTAYTTKGSWGVTTGATIKLPNTFGSLPTPVTSAQVVINEVESQPQTGAAQPGDWIELKNKQSTALHVGGLVLTDDDPTHTYTIPLGTNIPASGYLVVRVDDPASTSGSFGLGNVDAARLYNSGTDFSDPNNLPASIDETSWTSHADHTWGRIPNETGPFGQTGAPTPGAVNVAP
ncbi:lamin tail domain-containing protein [Leucobacter weissii]|uniref:Lamin tail domain-containing protein n=1 Tax=Leucobacter weissii TaxID=1983706 RepID=A0A939MI09_9MICO|nr:lamin tail domain-containing protein [Leucobacter weissii]MBO1900605.1 lamin tail domain-containing protein [Leucobacter weissii]